MVQIDRYCIAEKLSEGSETLIYRAVRDADQRPVVLKFPKSKYPTARALAQLRHEYSILRELDLPGVIKVYGLETCSNGPALVLEDFGGCSLEQLAQAQPLGLDSILQIAVGIADALASLHGQPILHKDIKPRNILLNPRTQELKLIGFSLSTPLSQELHRTLNSGPLEGTLAYMSPEQTGRMNRVVDPRSDLYSFGVTLYELLTGVLPFQTTDPTEMIHSHIARQSVPPRERVARIPQVLSDLVMKLLAKAAEERYQSAHGLKVDLLRCLTEWKQSGGITAFSLGQRDAASELRIPQRLYGREVEMAALLDAFEYVSRGGAELLLLSGYAGVGKSALVQEIYRGIAQRAGYFISGKFDQIGRHIPYIPVAHAFRELIRQLLTESPEALERWKRALLAALGPNGALLVRLIPELELIIGPQPGVPDLGPTESKNRFSLVFQNVLRVFATREHPLVLFLDDLQWADPASLKLLQILLSDPERGHLLVIGAYREQEVDATHQLRSTRDELFNAGVKITECYIKPLELPHIEALLCDMLGADQSRVASLAQLIFHKTQGNPFFLNQFLSALYKERLLFFDAGAGVWTWELARIAAAQVTDNVVEFMTAKLRRLAVSTQRLLKLAACIGHKFEVDLLTALDGRSPAESAVDLWEALKEGLILPLDSAYRFLPSGPEPSTELGLPSPEQALHISCKFLHDRVQQAAYSLIPDDEKRQLHLRIGRWLQARSESAQVDTGLFDLVNHLNFGAELITQPDERLNLARLNLAAGKRAKRATAYATATSYLKAGMQFLAADGWQLQYELTFGLYIERAECEYLNGRFQEAELLFGSLLTGARSVQETAHICALRTIMHTTRGQFTEAIAAGRVGLQLFEIELPESEVAQQVALDAVLAELQLTSAMSPVEDLLNAPAMTDPAMHAVSRLLMELVAPAYFTTPTLFALITAQMVSISQQHGNSELSAYGYLAYGFLLAASLGRPTEAYAFGRLGLGVHERFHNSNLTSKLNFLFGIYQHLCKPLRSAIPYLTQAVDSGLATGDLTYASFACHHIGFTRLGLGDTLGMAREEVDRFLALMQRTQDVVSIRTLTITRQAIASLEGRTYGAMVLDDDRFEEQRFLADMEVAEFTMGCCYFYFTKLQLLFLYGDYRGALEMAAKAEQRQWSAFGLYYRTELPLYTGLTLAALYPGVAADEQSRYLEKIRRQHVQITTWAQGCPENFLHQQLLLEAELMRITGKPIEAMSLYDQASAAAQRGGFIQLEALVNERCGEFHLSAGRERVGTVYLAAAHEQYLRWGALAKVSALEARYPALQSSALRPRRATLTGTVSDTASATLDLTAVLKAAQAISGEIVLDRLVSTLMRIVVENAGAQRGLLLLVRDGKQLYTAAHLGIAPESTEQRRYAESIVNYVARTQESIVLHSAATDGLFTADPYIVGERPKSLLCAPLIEQGRLVAIIYLENNLSFGAFTNERLQTVQLLSAQAAMSLHNASLYATLEQKVMERTNELQQKNAALTAAMDNLRETQRQLIQQEKLASLGSLTAGIAHELKNPLNFINNFAELTASLADELADALTAPALTTDDSGVTEMLQDLRGNAQRIQQHGQRATGIINGMLMHSRHGSQQREKVDLHALLTESVSLAYHGQRASGSELQIQFETYYDPGIDTIELVRSDISRVVINILNNACYAAQKKLVLQRAGYTPTIMIRTRACGSHVELSVRDNGIGMPRALLDNIFTPFFTTKAPGEGTGLGLSISHDIVVQGHSGQIRVDTVEGEFTEIVISLPCRVTQGGTAYS